MSSEEKLTADSESSSQTASTRCNSDSNDSLTCDSDKCNVNFESVRCGDDNVKDEKCCEEKVETNRRICCGRTSQLIWGVLLIILSVTGFIFTPLDFMLWEKLNMRPGLPPYEWWIDPPDEVRLRAYVFNVTNHDRFLAGEVEKLDVQEIGPVVYLEKLLHSNVTFNDNSTMTYTAKRYPIFLPGENDIDLNATIYVPNMAVLGLASYLHQSSFFIKLGFKLLVQSQHSPFFVKKTIHEYLWDFQDPVLALSKTIAPGLVPVNNMGMLARIYDDFTDEMTVKIGPRWGHEQFFQIDNFRGNLQIPGYDPEICPDRIVGSTEGVMYRQHLTKQDVLQYWRKTVCKLMPLYFDSELTVENVPVYRYNLSESVFERVTNDTDCYDTKPGLQSGLSDASRCYFDYPMVVSYPHFYTGGVEKDQFVTGLKPDRAKHNSYAIVEPLTGTPFRSVARMQSNLQIKNLNSFDSEYGKLSNMIIPLCWVEYNQENLPTRIKLTLYFMVVILPPLSKLIAASTLLLGFYLVTKYIIHYAKIQNDTLKSIILIKSKNVNTIAKNKIFAYEKEAFLKRPS